ncbi:hypothetical protein FIBSPDRAFT_897182 [Athelia psychrophila]|uniref:Uncharacterized protein n=1 Tax=Athelia psychrophila TaxID=1759441 RepID=A0A167XNW9_9AGAM|nr:hypothetical protein FIBSPDRAFT_939528 [Fibularhizoctonia sp. CBS 109695]KZP13749.1 hypothetical protein FIBSPDRAFT_897182 [Fibularhizoctonia sp. CBS 109695]
MSRRRRIIDRHKNRKPPACRDIWCIIPSWVRLSSKPVNQNLSSWGSMTITAKSKAMRGCGEWGAISGQLITAPREEGLRRRGRGRREKDRPRTEPPTASAFGLFHPPFHVHVVPASASKPPLPPSLSLIPGVYWQLEQVTGRPKHRVQPI